jgi:FkbM family methyltransferase
MELLKTTIGDYIADPRDEFVCKELKSTGDYQPSERALYFHLLKPTDNILWLGAHIGALLLPLSRVVESVVAFEANPHTISMFERNIEINSAKNITPHNLAVSDRFEKISFVCNVVNSGGSKRMPIVKDPMYFDDKTEILDIEAISIDAFLPDEHFDFIFMDIEGSEYAAIKGMPSAIARCRVLVAEFIPHHLKNVANITVDQFLEPLQAFQYIYIPEVEKTVSADDARQIFHKMYAENIWSSGCIFFNDEVLDDSTSKPTV